MNVLCFTFEAPTKKYGGGLGILQSLASISPNAAIDYVGPAFDLNEFPEIKIRTTCFLQQSTHFAQKCVNLVRGVSVKYFSAWSSVVKRLDPSRVDFVFVDFSYNDFIIRWAHRNHLKVLVRVHNIEHDMVQSILRSRCFDQYWVKALVNGLMVWKREAACLRMADGLVFLTQNDLHRAKELYQNIAFPPKSHIVPVCLFPPVVPLCQPADIHLPCILITGSLFYGANVIGVKWFLCNVWPFVNRQQAFPSVRLVIAGGKPSSEIKRLCAQAPNCTLVDSPEDMTPYFERATLYAAPVFSGAGMKMKVVEALSHGLCVIGTDHAFIGYEDAGPFLIRANTPKEFEEQITRCLQNQALLKQNENCRVMFMRHYSMERSQKAFGDIITAMLSALPISSK